MVADSGYRILGLAARIGKPFRIERFPNTIFDPS